MADVADDKDVPMEAQDESAGTKEDSENKSTEEQEEQKEADPGDDSGAASETEFAAEDDRFDHADQDEWTWHIEVYPVTPEDTVLDNFIKLTSISEQSNVVFRTNESGEKRGEAHFYTNEIQVAKVIMRTICCRKFNIVRPFVYLYHRHEDGETESAIMRLDLVEAAKMRWDRQRKNVGEPNTRVAKVSNVPLSTTKEFLSVVFARAFHIKRESDESEEAAKKASEAEGKSKETKNEENKDEEDKDESNEEDEEELVGEFNGNLTVDCVSRTSLKGFLLGYRKVHIADYLLTIRAFSEKDFSMEDLRREVRKKRKEDAAQLSASKSGKLDDSKSGGKPGNRGSPRGARGVRGGVNRGGRGDYRSSNRGGGIMTGRQKMEEKMRRGGGRGVNPGIGRGGGGGLLMMRDDMQYQMAMNTYRLERQMISMRGAGGARGRGGYGMMGIGGGYRDYVPDPYDMPHLPPRGYDVFDPRDDWAYRSYSAPRYGNGLGMDRIPTPRRGIRGRRQ